MLLRAAAATATVAAVPTLERQLRLLRGFGLLTYPFACVPFLFLWFQSHGLDAAGYGEVLSTYYLAMLLAEVPTGMLADRFGQKGMLVLGPGVLAAGFATLLLWPTRPGFLIGEALLGCGHAVLSGPPTVMLYESLCAHGQEARYLAEEARVNARRMLGTGCSFALGGLFAHLGDPDHTAYGLTIAVTCGLELLAAGIALRTIAAPRASSLRARHLLRHVGGELRKPAVAWLCAYWVVLFALLRFPFHNYQPYLSATAALEPWFGQPLLVGSLFTVLNLFAAPLSSLLPRLVARHGRLWLFWLMPLVLAGSLLVMAGERLAAAAGQGSVLLAWCGVCMFFVQQVPFGMHQSLLNEFVNHRLGATARTTVLSTLSLLARLAYAGLNLLLFRLQARHGLGPALGLAGLVGAVATCLVMWARPRGTLRGSDPIG
ncbi:MAG: MFS transporter [Planctomycetes bacterium]|nr:MFS transporter [Planctomycetota bacterium]